MMAYASVVITAGAAIVFTLLPLAARARRVPGAAHPDAAAGRVRGPRGPRRVDLRQRRRRHCAPATTPRRRASSRAACASRASAPWCPHRSQTTSCIGCSPSLPRPLPTGDPWNEYVLTNLLVHGGAYREAATYGAESYARPPQPLLAATIARAAGGVGDEATAIAWLRAAVHDGTSAQGVLTVIDRAPSWRPAPPPGGRGDAPDAPARQLTPFCVARLDVPGTCAVSVGQEVVGFDPVTAAARSGSSLCQAVAALIIWARIVANGNLGTNRRRIEPIPRPDPVLRRRGRPPRDRRSTHRSQSNSAGAPNTRV